ncbi:MAG: hypothetical protein JF607_06025 [Burkholderiales bacterium]|jgi:hypothetical protein|nr:hypothetical protein [Burkholderiales bacterium]
MTFTDSPAAQIRAACSAAADAACETPVRLADEEALFGATHPNGEPVHFLRPIALQVAPRWLDSRGQA